MKLGDWQDAYEKASVLVEGLTTTEKLSIIARTDVNNFTALQMLDSSTIPYTYYYVTTWPAGLAMAMTWNQTGIHEQGQSLGEEFRGKESTWLMHQHYSFSEDLHGEAVKERLMDLMLF